MRREDGRMEEVGGGKLVGGKLVGGKIVGVAGGTPSPTIFFCLGALPVRHLGACGARLLGHVTGRLKAEW